MFLNNADQTLDVTFRCRHGDRSYVVFASTDSLRCFECGDLGHKKFACPHKNKSQEQNVASGLREASSSLNKDSGLGEMNPDTDRMQATTAAAGGEVERAVGEALAGVSTRLAPGEVSAAALPPVSGVGRPKRSGKRAAKAASGTLSTSGDSNVTAVDHSVNVGEKLGEEESEARAPEDLAANREEWIEEPGRRPSTAGMEEGVIEEDDGAVSDSSSVSELTTSQMGDGSVYSAKEIVKFLVETKGKSVVLSDYFPDGNKFLRSVKSLSKKADLQTLSPKKSFQLKKWATVVRKTMI